MKSLVALALLALALPALVLANTPPLLAPQAAAIAQKDLDDRGLQTEIFIADMRYKKASFGDKAHWEVLWSDSFPAQTEGRDEIGLKIFMDGNYSRSVR
ncbi:MAG: hypothetical protein P1U81_07860 [Verrucomicrobiales bacterium]|jgi:hypothetical protein|nr:hypothetical protein [bacterium]MDF2376143.1 hypothetical protein [Verrucomicrobiales bacterium]